MTAARIRGVLFDLDGTLGNTLPVCYEAFRRVFRQRLGRLNSDQQIHAMFGPSEEGILRMQLPSEADEALADYLREYRDAHQDYRNPFAGIAATLRLLRRRGVKTAIVTGKGPRSAAISLEIMGLSPFFEIVESGSAMGAVKPTAMRRVLERWSIFPIEAAGVGDAASDIQAAKQVGITSVAAAWAPTARRDILSSLDPDHLFETVADLHGWLDGATRESEN